MKEGEIIANEQELLARIAELEQENQDLKNKLSREGTGRPTNQHLYFHLVDCWNKEMKDCEIIGSTYQGYNGVETVTHSSYYRLKKKYKK